MDISYAREAAEQREIDEAKKGATHNVRPVSSPASDEDVESAADLAWAPGFWVRFPWLGFGALFIVLLTSAGSILTLMLSNGRSETRWVKQLPPNVILGQMNNIANICFGLAIGNGIAIAWWRKTLQGATIKQLHRSWAFSTSVKEVALAGKYFNFIALAALTTKLTIIDSSLMQKAFSTYVGTDLPRNVTNIMGNVNDTIPITGILADRDWHVSSLSGALASEIQNWATNGHVYNSTFTGCNGLCFLDVPAAGFEFDCTDPAVTNVDYGQSTEQAMSLFSQSSVANLTAADQAYVDANLTAQLFSVNFTATYADPTLFVPLNDANYSYITMNVLSSYALDSQGDDSAPRPGKRQALEFSNPICPGYISQQTCTLRPAVVSYPIVITNYPGAHTHNGLQLGTPVWVDPKNRSNIAIGSDRYEVSLKQQPGFKVLRYNDVFEVGMNGVLSRLGGLQKAFDTYLGGTADLAFKGAVGYAVTLNNSAYKYQINTDLLNSSSCGYQFRDQFWTTQDLVSAINEIMFLNAMKDGVIDPGTTVYQQDQPKTRYNAIAFNDTVHYQTDIWYMIGAVISTFICVLCVLPTYWGFWQLGRKVALSPFEIAAAFRSPMVNTGGTIDDIIKEKGHQPVQYGHIVTGDAAGRLGIAEPEYVERAHPTIGSARKEISEKFSFGKSSTN